MGRLLKGSLIGGVLGGLVSAIPVLNFFNLCCCLLIQAGAVAGLAIHFSGNPNDRMQDHEAAASGALSGAIGGLLGDILGTILWTILGGILASVMNALPDFLVSQMTATGFVSAFIHAMVAMVVGTGFGALAGVGGLHLIFKEKRIG